MGKIENPFYSNKKRLKKYGKVKGSSIQWKDLTILTSIDFRLDYEYSHDYNPKNIEMEMPWIVRKVKPQNDYTLLLQFDDGKQGIFDMLPIIQQEDGGDDTFVHLKNIKEFMRAHVFACTVFWPGDISIAPETLYDECMTLQEYEERCAKSEEDET